MREEKHKITVLFGEKATSVKASELALALTDVYVNAGVAAAEFGVAAHQITQGLSANSFIIDDPQILDIKTLEALDYSTIERRCVILDEHYLNEEEDDRRHMTSCKSNHIVSRGKGSRKKNKNKRWE